MLGIFKDRCAETDIQLLDQDVVKTINQLPQKNRQLRVLDSFVGFPIDIIQLEIDNKVKDNKLYEEKTKKFKVCRVSSFLSFFIGAVGIAVPIVGMVLKWTLPAVLIIFLLALGVFGLIMSFIFNIKKTLHYRVGEQNELPELNDLRNKLEKYNIANKK